MKTELILATVPNTNRVVSAYLYVIETGLREFIIATFTNIDPPNWYKTRLSGAALDKFRKGRAEEQDKKWIRQILHHPIYYLDFSHIREIIVNNRNWSDAFGTVFQNKAMTETSLAALEPIRNRVAHNRVCSDHDMDRVRLTYEDLSNCLQPKQLLDFASSVESITDLPTIIQEVQNEIELAFVAVSNYASLPVMPTFTNMLSSWWLDVDYLGSPVSQIVAYSEKLFEYRILPRSKGTGHLIEAWLKQSDYKSSYTLAVNQIKTLLNLYGVNT